MPEYAQESVELCINSTTTLQGPEMAGVRQALMDLALAVDRARDKDGDPRMLSRCAATLLEGLTTFNVPVEEVTLDDFDRLTSELSAGPVRDSKES